MNELPTWVENDPYLLLREEALLREIADSERAEFLEEQASSDEEV